MQTSVLLKKERRFHRDSRTVAISALAGSCLVAADPPTMLPVALASPPARARCLASLRLQRSSWLFDFSSACSCDAALQTSSGVLAQPRSHVCKTTANASELLQATGSGLPLNSASAALQRCAQEAAVAPSCSLGPSGPFSPLSHSGRSSGTASFLNGLEAAGEN